MTGWLPIALVAAGSGLIVAAVWARWPALIGWGLAALGAAYAVGLSSGGVTLTAPLLAAGLLALAEAAFHGAERASGTEYSAREGARIAGAAVVGLAVSVLVLLAATIAVRSSLVLTLGGTLAAVIAIALPSARFRRRV